MLHFWFADTVIVPIIQIAIFCTWPVKLSTYYFYILTEHDSTGKHKGTGYNYSPLSFLDLENYMYIFLYILYVPSQRLWYLNYMYIYLFIPSQRHGLAYLNFTHCTCSNCSCTSAYDWWVSILAYALFLYANVCFLLLEVYCIIRILQVVSDILFQDYTIVWDNYNDMDCSFRSDSLQFWSILFPLHSLFLPPLSCWMHSCS